MLEMQYHFLNNLLIKTHSPTIFKRIALGLSNSSWELLQRLKARKHVDLLALTEGAACQLDSPSEDLLVGSAQEILRSNCHSGGILIVVGAIGAVTRLIAPLLISILISVRD